jgi:hypothetical protein
MVDSDSGSDSFPLLRFLPGPVVRVRRAMGRPVRHVPLPALLGRLGLGGAVCQSVVVRSGRHPGGKGLTTVLMWARRRSLVALCSAAGLVAREADEARLVIPFFTASA